MRVEWTTKRLGEVCDVVNGGTPKTTVAEYWGGSHCWITPAEMGGDAPPYREKTRRTITDAGLLDSSASLLPANSVILSSRAPIGHLVINLVPMATNQGCKSLVPRAAIDYKFLYYYLKSIVPLLESLGTGATFKELSTGKLKNVLINFPPLPEQRRIVALLDEAFAGLATATANAERNLDNARELFEGYLAEVFSRRGDGWVERRLRDICEIKHGFAFEGKYFANEGEFVLLTPGNFNESGGYRDRGEKQKFYTGPIPNDFVLNEGDLLVAMTEQAAGLLGSPVLVPGAQRFLHNQRLGLVKPTPNVEWDPRFLFHVFNLPMVRKAIHDSASGTKVRHTSPTKIGDVLVYIPLMSTQRSIVAVLEAHFAETQVLAQIYKQKQAALAALKRSLLHQAFNGEL